MTKKTTKQGKKLPGGNDAVAQMNQSLIAEYTEIKALVIKVDRQDGQARYEIAVHCQTVRDGDGSSGTYGKGAVRKLAEALGWSDSTVYEYANVAKSWPDKKAFKEVAGQAGAYDRPLPWSHIVLLASVANPERRDELLQGALKHGWNLRELRKQLRDGMAGEDASTPIAAPQPKVPRVLVAAVENYMTQVVALRGNTATFGAHLADQIKQADPADLTDSVMERLATARRDLSDLLKQLDGYIAQVRQRRSSTLDSRDGWDGRPTDHLRELVCNEHHLQQAEEALAGTL